jgi:hypothetical protein
MTRDAKVDGCANRNMAGWLGSFRMTELPLVSVVIPAWNAAAFVGEAIESARAQTWPHLEVIVVDDGSTDETPAALRRYDDAPDVRVIRQDNAGPAAARNRGVEAGRGEFIAFLDADDLWRPTKVRKQLDAFRRNPKLGLVYTLYDCSIRDERGQWVEDTSRNRRYAGRQDELCRGWCFRQVVEHAFIALPSVLIPRPVLDRVGLFDTGLTTAEDRHLYARIARRYPIDYVDEELVTVRRHGANLSGDPGVDPQTFDFFRKIAQMFPDCAPRRAPWMRQALARIGRETGFDSLYQGQMRHARRALWQACRYRPTRLSNWLLLLAALLPGCALRAIRSLKRRLLGSIGPRR